MFENNGKDVGAFREQEALGDTVLEIIEKIKEDVINLIPNPLVVVIALLTTLIVFIWLLTWFGKRNDSKGKSCWGWVGAIILTYIPIVSIIMLCIWSFGKKTKDDFTFRSWARLNLIVIISSFVFVGSLLLTSLLY